MSYLVAVPEEATLGTLHQRGRLLVASMAYSGVVMDDGVRLDLVVQE